MPRYFFHTVDGTHDIDTIGHDLPGDAAAQREAIRYAGGLLADDPDIVVSDEAFRINVTKEDGRLSCSIIILSVDAGWTSSGPGDIATPTASRPA